VGFALAIFFLILLYIYYEYENRRRDRKHGPPGRANTDYVAEDFLNLTDRQIPSFRYIL
jgi:hypothetical protein